ncbi:hypothetical protein Taro_020460, partial [Colocasia esculenta]|nr:hypothetical protein [Colocasia esculenta]
GEREREREGWWVREVVALREGACITGAVGVVFSILVVSSGSALTTRWAAAWPREIVSCQAEIAWAKCVGPLRFKMKSKANNTIQRPNKLQQAHLEGSNWMLVVGGALLSTLSIRLGWKLKQIFETKRPDDARNTLKEESAMDECSRQSERLVPTNAYKVQELATTLSCFRCGANARAPDSAGGIRWREEAARGGPGRSRGWGWRWRAGHGSSRGQSRRLLAAGVGRWRDWEAEAGKRAGAAGMSQGRADTKHTPTSPMSKGGDPILPLVAISVTESNKDNGVMWASSPEHLELPPRPFHHSNTSDSSCVLESGSDIFSKREVIQKLRRQLKRRDEMILDMQSQITELQKSLSAQIAQSTNLQSQLDCANRELFDSEREIQRLRKAIADHCVADADSPNKSVMSQNWPSETVNGHAKGYTNGYANGFADNVTVVESNYARSEKGRDSERVEMLKREVGELKEVIEGKEFLVQSYKEQKAEPCTKVKELQLRIASQVPNIL